MLHVVYPRLPTLHRDLSLSGVILLCTAIAGICTALIVLLKAKGRGEGTLLMGMEC
jgi:hypothetical protein